MHRLLVLAIALMAFVTAYSQQVLKPVDEKSSVKFKIKNFGFNTVTASLKGVQGTIRFTPENLSSSTMDVTVDSKSVNTGINMRDNHLRKPEYFDVKKYPTIRFVSSKITPSSKSGTLFISDKLTIKNVTREVSFPFTVTPEEDGYVFSGEFKINRIDFGVGESSSVSDNLTVVLKVFARRG